MSIVIKKLKQLINDMDKPLLVMTILFFVVGLFNIVTASSREAVSHDASLYHFFFKQLQMIGIGLILGLIIVNIPTKKYYKLSFLGLIIIMGMVLYTLIDGSNSHRGVLNWIRLPVIGSVQPSEFAKPVIIVCLAFIFERFIKELRDKNNKSWDIIAMMLLIGCLTPFFVFMQKDFGNMMILGSIFLIMFLASPLTSEKKLKTIGILGSLVIVLGFFMFALKGYILSDEQMRRFQFFDPCSDYEDTGYQTCNGFIAINDGGLFGLGIGKSKQKYSYIPEPHTDSVFAIIVEELGLIRVIPMFLLYIFILYRILSLSSKASTIRGKYIALGVGSYIFLHIFVNLGGLFGLIPLTGVPLPFLSYGGSFTISLIAALAIVQRVHIEYRNQKITIK